MSLVDTIQDKLNDLNDLIGNKMLIPPRVADMVESRRRLYTNVVSKVEDTGVTHTGWMEVHESLAIEDGMTRLLMCEELAEAWSVPLSFMTAFDFTMYTEPARMYIINRGVIPLLQQGRCMPHLLRIAYDGAMEEMWDMEDVLTLPPAWQSLPASVMENLDFGEDNTGNGAWFA
jgi:hypothetical protein|tara:strand:+ start:41 stop:562 length:522 start_codon:yes stop_codon:yes gene_type:complete